MKPEDCSKLDKCYKVEMILDKDLLDFHYAEAIGEVLLIAQKSRQVASRLVAENVGRKVIKWCTPNGKDYSGNLGITKGWRAHSSRLFVRRATATNVKYTLIGRS